MTHSMVSAWARRAPVPDWIALAAVLETCAGIVIATHPRLPIDLEVLAEALAIRYGASPQRLVVIADEHMADVQELMRGKGSRDSIRHRSMLLLQELDEGDPTFRERLFSFEQNVAKPPPQRVTKPLPAVEPDVGHPLVRAFVARAPMGFQPPVGLRKYLVELVASARFSNPQLPVDEIAFAGTLGTLFGARPDVISFLRRLDAAELHLVQSCATSDVARDQMRARFATAVRRLCDHYVAPNGSLDDVLALFWSHLFSTGSDPRALTLDRFDGTTSLEDFVVLNGHAGLILHARLRFAR